MAEERVACRTPTPGRDGVTRIPAWKFDAVRAAILAILREGDAPFADLTEAVAARLPDEMAARIGSVGWHVATVKLEMEVRGEIARRRGPGPQVLTLAGEEAR